MRDMAERMESGVASEVYEQAEEERREETGSSCGKLAKKRTQMEKAWLAATACRIIAHGRRTLLLQ